MQCSGSLPSWTARQFRWSCRQSSGRLRYSYYHHHTPYTIHSSPPICGNLFSRPPPPPHTHTHALSLALSRAPSLSLACSLSLSVSPVPHPGDLTFENLRFKQTPIDGVPLQILGGELLKLVLRVPWDHLKATSTVVIVDAAVAERPAKPKARKKRIMTAFGRVVRRDQKLGIKFQLEALDKTKVEATRRRSSVAVPTITASDPVYARGHRGGGASSPGAVATDAAAPVRYGPAEQGATPDAVVAGHPPLNTPPMNNTHTHNNAITQTPHPAVTHMQHHCVLGVLQHLTPNLTTVVATVSVHRGQCMHVHDTQSGSNFEAAQLAVTV